MRTLDGRLGRILVAPVVAMIAVVATACGSGAGTGADQRTVTVLGTGEVSGVPDTLHAEVGVETSGSDVSTALNAANSAISQLTEAVVEAGVDRSDVRTRQVGLNPRYTTPEPGSAGSISGYDATNTVGITIRGVDRASEILGVAATAGGDATRINSVSMSIDDDTELVGRAREAAFTDARTRAEQYASLAGDSLGSVVTITETTAGGDQPLPGVFGRDMAAEAVTAVPIEPGEQTLRFTVTVTFELS